MIVKHSELDTRMQVAIDGGAIQSSEQTNHANHFKLQFVLQHLHVHGE